MMNCQHYRASRELDVWKLDDARRTSDYAQDVAISSHNCFFNPHTNKCGELNEH